MNTSSSASSPTASRRGLPLQSMSRRTSSTPRPATYQTSRPISRVAGPEPRTYVRANPQRLPRLPVNHGQRGIMKQQAQWQEWPDLIVKVKGLPLSMDTWQLFSTFEKHGNIVYVFLFDSNGRRDGTAMIKFSPPPLLAFWDENPYSVRFGNSSYSVYLYPEKPKSSSQIQSPIKPHIFYDQKMKLVGSTLQFGIMLQPNTIMPMQTLESDKRGNMTFVVDLFKKQVVVDFVISFRDSRNEGISDPSATHSVGFLDRDNRFKFEMPFGLLQCVYMIDFEGGNFALVITLNSPPRYFKKSTEIEKTHIPGNSTWSENDTWWRYTDIVYDPYRLRTRPVALPREKPVVDIGRWKTYRMIFRKAQNEERLIEQMKNALQDFNIEVKVLTDLHEEPEQPTPLWSLIDPPRHLHPKESEWSTDLKSLDNGEGAAFLPFDVRYQLEVCLSRDILNEYNITSEFVQRLAEMSRRDSNKARTILEYIVEQDKRIYDPMTIFDDPEALDYSPKTKIPYYCGYARKATVTPSTIIFSSPTVETTNRVTRHYSKENDDGRFLRVQFTDEHFEGRINSNADKGCDDEVYTRVYRTLVNGIQIGDRHYQFLAFGNSQFRENGAYFFCPTEHLSCDDIRRWMGNFKHIRIPAKYAARLGQCFSTTRAINGMSAPVIVKIPDIERTFQGHKYCFTDGVGKISNFLAQMIAAELGTNSQPSAFQFRLGGCKGILVVSSDAKDKEVHIRESQQKFSATYNGLEIIRCSRFSCASLNRQVITILSSLGVEDQVFLDMLSEQLSNYQKAISDNTLALELLGRYIDDNHMTLNIASMILNGFMTEKEPFVLSLLHLWRSWSIKLLKEKAKIIVEEGAFVLGCVDETGTLRGYTASKASDANQSRSFQEDELPQIFIQVPDKTDSTQYKVIEGICLIGRNPSLHPGDIRIVQAINVPALHHLRDVVVFPQTGDRDIPSMCSGGDLDGDDFFVIWDKNLRPKEWNNEPMNYLPPAPLELNRSVRVGDLIKFFVKFMKNDALPTIAHNHLAQSDYLTNGVKDRKCLELASLHSKAVDYVKTGQPAEMPQRLRIAKWPHFLEKKHKSKNKIYHSQKILGQLYDRVESVDFVPQYDRPFDKRILKAYKLESSILKSARQIKSKYDTAMRRIMAQQEIKTEFEVWTTFVLSKPRVGSDYKVQEDMEKITGALKARFQEVCIETAGGKDFSMLGPFVAAMYRVTKEEMDIALAECRTMKIAGGREVPKRKMEPRSMPLMSFPWLFEKELGRIATGIEASDELEDLGLFNITTKGKGQAHTRHGGAATEEDFIEMEDGGVVHRGEELDLFKPIRGSEDSDELSFDEDDFEDSHADHKYIMGKSGELMLDTSNYDPEAEGLLAPTKSKLVNTKRFDEDETAEEDIMPKTVLDGFINPRKTGETPHDLRRAPHNEYAAAESHRIIQNDNRDQSTELATRNPSFFDMLSLDSSSMEDSDAPEDNPVDSPAGLTGSDSGRSSPNRLDYSHCSVTASGFDECMAEEEKEEEEVVIDEKPSSLEKLARLNNS